MGTALGVALWDRSFEEQWASFIFLIFGVMAVSLANPFSPCAEGVAYIVSVTVAVLSAIEQVDPKS